VHFGSAKSNTVSFISCSTIIVAVELSGPGSNTPTLPASSPLSTDRRRRSL